MDYKAVITGDIVDSSKNLDFRELLLDVIKTTCDRIKGWGLSYDIYRGDSVQLLIDKPENALRIAIILRCAIKSSTPKGCQNKWDARLSIGIGNVEYDSGNPATSDGDAFRLSGRGLDAIKKSRMVIDTPWIEFNDAVSVSNAFLDNLITSWSISQSGIMYQYLLSDVKNKTLAENLGISPQNLSKKLKRMEADNVELFLEYFEKTVRKLKKQ